MLTTSWPTRAVARLNVPRKSRKGHNVASRRTYDARLLRVCARKIDDLQVMAERRRARLAGAMPPPASPAKGERFDGCPPVTVGAGASAPQHPLYGRTDCPDQITRFVPDGDNTVRDAERMKIVRAMIKAGK